MTEVHQIITQKNSRQAYITSGKTRLRLPITTTSLVFLPHFLEKEIECEYQPVEGDNQLSLNSAAFSIVASDVYLFTEIFSKEVRSDRYRQYLFDLNKLAESASPFFDANAYQIEFPNPLYAKYEDQIEDIISILAEDESVAARGVQLTRRFLGMGRDKLLHLLFSNDGKTEKEREKKKSADTGRFEHLIKGTTVLSPVITYFNIVIPDKVSAKTTPKPERAPPSSVPNPNPSAPAGDRRSPAS